MGRWAAGPLGQWCDRANTPRAQYFVPAQLDTRTNPMQIWSAYFVEQGVEWVQSYLLLNHSQGFCELYAPNAEVIQVGYRRVGEPFHRVWSARVIQA